MKNIYFAEETWSQIKDNPFSRDGGYGEKWSSFIYDDSVSYYTNIKQDAKVYSLTVNPSKDEEFERLIDFVTYETSHGRNVIVKVPKGLKDIVYNKLSSINKNLDNNIIRPTDSRWLVHSTTKPLWKEIKSTGGLVAPNTLKKKGKDIKEIGLKPLLEPADYSDYIMLDVLNGCGELVVNSRQLGYVCTDVNMKYTPGVRMYFDGHKIIKDGLATRDGLHVLKVKDYLPLDKYMVLAINEDMIKKQSWTPSSFTEAANEYFLEYVNLQNIK